MDWAPDRDEALSLLRSFPYGLVVLDTMLPGRDGFSVTEELRSKIDDLPILMPTALDGVDGRIKGPELGENDYLVKPFNLGDSRPDACSTASRQRQGEEHVRCRSRNDRSRQPACVLRRPLGGRYRHRTRGARVEGLQPACYFTCSLASRARLAK